jgi:hypothetical protein
MFAAMLVASSIAMSMEMPREARVPGGIAYVKVPGGEQPPRVLFGGYQTAVIRKQNDWIAVVGIPLATKPGVQSIQVFDGKSKQDVSFEVLDKRYRTQNLTIKNQRQVDPNPDDLKRIGQEQERSSAAL